MHHTRIRLWLVMLVVVGLVLVGLLNVPSTAAQCGSSVSSCKNCHEVQGQDPVNDKGDWHTAHAFGDFCEFCHAGNVQAKAKEEAHAGMVDPLADVQAGCQSCHPDDYMDKAQVYATALGVELTSGGGGSTAPPAGGGGGPASGTGETSKTGNTGGSAPAAALDLSKVTAPGALIVDYNEIYGQGVESQRQVNWGNVTFAILDVLGLALLVGLITYREHLWSRFQQLRQVHFEPGMNLAAAMAGGGQVSVPSFLEAVPVSPDDLMAQNPALASLFPHLAKASPVVLASLERLLADEAVAEDLLSSLSHLDLRLVEQARALDERDLDLLVALVREMR